MIEARMVLAGLATLVLVTQIAGDPPAAGTIQGVVRFTGSVPPAQEILTTEGLGIVHNDLLVHSKSKGLRYVVAVLEDAPAQPKAQGLKPVVMDQKGMVFVPRVVAVQHGQPIRFDNSDGCNHSVHAVSTLAANSFNIFVNGHTPYMHVFEPQHRVVPLGCALHAWMKGWVYVLPHSWFAVTDEQGRFRIENVPPGTYTLWLRHPDSGLQERRKVVVKSRQSAEVAVEWQKVAR